MQFLEVVLGALLLESASAVAIDKNAAAKTAKVDKRDPNAHVNAPAAVNTINNDDGIGAGSNKYTAYAGNGTPGNGWPSQSQWVSFVDMFNNNKPSMFASCGNDGLANDSGPEVGSIYNGIQQIAQQSGVDHRFILAVIMQESNGCVRIGTTIDPSGTIYNPGLMQDFDGYYTCNTSQNDEYHENLGVVNPCPQDTITQMIREGAVGTDSGDGLATLINDAQSQGASGAQTFYYAARWYNSGEDTPPIGGDLSNGGSTNTYASDIANRLTGWTD